MASRSSRLNATYTVSGEEKQMQDAFVAQYGEDEGDVIVVKKASKGKATRKPKMAKKMASMDEVEVEPRFFLSENDEAGDHVGLDDITELNDDVRDAVDDQELPLRVQKPGKTYSNRRPKVITEENSANSQSESESKKTRKPKTKSAALDDVIEASADVEEAVKKPARRGRKPKTAISALNDVIEAAVNEDPVLRNDLETRDEESIKDEVLTKGPVRRGRKPKAKIPPADENQRILDPVENQRQDDLEATEEVQHLNRRGRKAKAKTATTEEIAEAAAEEDHDIFSSLNRQLEDEIQIEKLTKVPARRGRKPKGKIPLAEEDLRSPDPMEIQQEDDLEAAEEVQNFNRRGKKAQAKAAIAEEAAEAAADEDRDNLSSMNSQLEGMKIEEATKGREPKAAAGPSVGTSEQAVYLAEELAKPVQTENKHCAGPTKDPKVREAAARPNTRGRKAKEAAETKNSDQDDDEAPAKPSTKRTTMKHLESGGVNKERAPTKKRGGGK